MQIQQIRKSLSLGVIGGLGAIGSADLYAKMTRAVAKSGKISLLFSEQAFAGSDMAGAENAQANGRKLYVFDMLRELEQRQCDAVLLPCFISHTFLDEVQAEIKLPVIDMMGAIRDHLAQRLPKLKKIGILTSSYVRKKALFEKYFHPEEMQLLYPDAAVQSACVMRAVYGTSGIKNGHLDGQSIELLYHACKELIDRGAQVIVPGITEIAAVADMLSARGIPIVDTNRIYAEFASHFQPVMRAQAFKIGVVGGVGPAATVDFMEKIISNTPAKRDQDHLKLVVEHNPKIPDRTNNLIADGADPTVAIYAACKRLENDHADMIAIPCNTAHSGVPVDSDYQYALGDGCLH